MAEEKKDEVPNPPVPPTKPEKKDEEIMIPKARFDEAIEAKKKAEEELSRRDAADKKAAEEKLVAEGKTKELLELREKENASLKLEVLKRDLIAGAITNKSLNPELSKMISGNTEEEIKQSIEAALAFQKKVEDDVKAKLTVKDDGGKPKGPNGEDQMSTEKWMEWYAKDPKAADEYLRKLNQGGAK